MGSGYVVQSMEAALWVFDRTHTLADAILMAANLGEDAETTAAVCGQLAGAFYGASAIPPHWLDRLAFRTEMTQLADQLRLRTLWIPPVSWRSSCRTVESGHRHSFGIPIQFSLRTPYHHNTINHMQ